MNIFKLHEISLAWIAKNRITKAQAYKPSEKDYHEVHRTP